MLIPGVVVSTITFPGVVVHELSHQLFCRFFRIPVYEVCYFRFGNPAGYVRHARIQHWQQNVLVAAGPFFINSLLGAFLSLPVSVGFDFEMSSLPGQLLFWLAVSISMHAIPSRGDAKNMWQAIRGKNAPFLAKLLIMPIIGIIYLFSIGSYIWLDLVYGVCICFYSPYLLAALFS